MVRTVVFWALTVALAAAQVDDGLQLQRAGRLPEAEVAYRAVIASEPGNVEALAGLATVVGWQGRHAEAEVLWRQAVAARPGDPDLAVGLARVRWWRGDVEGARDDLAAVLAAHPDHGEAAELAGRLAPQARLGWRVDVLAGGERATGGPGRAWLVGAALSATVPSLATLTAGGRRRWFTDAHESTGHIGLGRGFPGGVEVGAHAERTPRPVLAPRTALGVDLVWRPVPAFAPVVGWRRSWYDADRTDLLRPGARWHPVSGPWSEAHVEARAILSRSRESGDGQGWSLRAVLAHEAGWMLTAGYARADEARAPLPATHVETIALGLGWSTDRWGCRLDWEREDRRDDWRRDGLTAGVHIRF